MTESLDTATAGGRLVFSIFGALADFERQLIRDRTLAGLEAARARGRRGGRPTVRTPARIEAARALLARPGSTVTSVAKDLGVSRATLTGPSWPMGWSLRRSSQRVREARSESCRTERWYVVAEAEV